SGTEAFANCMMNLDQTRKQNAMLEAQQQAQLAQQELIREQIRQQQEWQRRQENRRATAEALGDLGRSLQSYGNAIGGGVHCFGTTTYGNATSYTNASCY